MAKPGRYRILRKIADGGMAEIFLATQRGAEGFERPVVLKRILAALVADPQFRNMMIDEAHVAMSLNHSNIAQVLDLGHAKGRYFLVLEFVDGWDLNQILNRVRAQAMAVPPELALYISAEVCRALSYAHGRVRDGKAMGIVHRDVSPHNVLISEHGEVKLTDFGIAKAMGRRERTGQGVIKGKLAFMSPEQASGLALDARSDLFSVGTMMYLMATGRKPFEAPTDLEAILRVRQCDFPAPTEVKADLSPKLSDIILRAMKRDPADRYQTAEEMLIDIEQVQRTVFQPAGQTELKRWLAALQQKDGIPPIGRAPGPGATETDAELLELVDGEDLVFEDSKVENVDAVIEGTIAERHRPPTAPTMAAATTPGPIPSLPPPMPRAATPTPTPVHKPRRGFSAFLLLGAAGIGGWIYLRLRKDEPTSELPPAPAAPAPEPVPAPATPPDPVPAPAAAPPAVDTATSPEAIATAEDASAAIEPAPIATAPDAAAEADEEEDDDDEEENLLKTAEPAQEATVDDEDSAPAAPPPKPSPTPTRAAPSTPDGRASVRLVTRPEGALVQLKGKHRTRNFDGRTPMSLRFKPGNYYDLAFVKKGYVTSTKRIFVSAKANQQVTVSMRKRPTRKRNKSILQRIFGR